MSKILVTGGLGYIGSILTVELVKRGHNVVIVDNLHNSNISKFFDICSILEDEDKGCNLKSKISFNNEDIRNEDGMRNIFLDNPDIYSVIHLASLKSVTESRDNKKEYYDVNVNGLINILFLMKEFGVELINFSSSVSVYGNSLNKSIEESKLNPISTYGATKLICEEVISDFHRDYNICANIFRFANPIGAYSNSLLGDQGSEKSIIRVLVDSIVNNKLFNVYGKNCATKDGSPVRDFINIMDVVNANIDSVEEFSETDSKDFYLNIVNLSSGKETTVMSALNILSEEIGMVMLVKQVNPRPGEIESSIVDNSKMIELGYSSTSDLRKDIVNAFLAEILNLPNKDSILRDLGYKESDSSVRNGEELILLNGYLKTSYDRGNITFRLIEEFNSGLRFKKVEVEYSKLNTFIEHGDKKSIIDKINWDE